MLVDSLLVWGYAELGWPVYACLMVLCCWLLYLLVVDVGVLLLDGGLLA